jgi:hypothetical protein
MTTSLVTSAIQHNTDAEFRAWAKQVSDQLIAVGMVRTTDTGQIDFTTVTRPAANTYTSYEVFKFPATDPLQATRPIFFKIGYGTGGSLNSPGLLIETGTGSSGAGVITGPHFLRPIGRHSPPDSVATPSHVCFVPALGALVFSGWNGSTNSQPRCIFFFSIQRPLDDAGASTAEGVSWYGLNTNESLSLYQYTYSYVTNTVISSGNSWYTFIPGGVGSSVIGTDIQLYRHYCSLPRVRNLPGLHSYFDVEIGKNGSFTATVLGTVRTLMPLGTGLQAVGLQAPPGFVAAMLFE